MSITQETYIYALTSILDAALCLSDFPSEISEKDEKPEVEINGYDNVTLPLCMNPIYLARNENEKCLIEPSINSCRISFAIKKCDQIDELICDKFSRYVAVRADMFQIIRRKPLEGYDFSFLITSSHLEKYKKTDLIQFIVSFIESIDKDISQLKLDINKQTRIAATYYVNTLSNNSVANKLQNQN